MKIIEEPAVDYKKKIVIIAAKNISDYRIKIQFNDGKTTVVDFKPFLKSAQHPSIKKYLNKDEFQKFNIVNGNLNWNDFDMIFPVADLKNGKLT